MSPADDTAQSSLLNPPPSRFPSHPPVSSIGTATLSRAPRRQARLSVEVGFRGGGIFSSVKADPISLDTVVTHEMTVAKEVGDEREATEDAGDEQ